MNSIVKFFWSINSLSERKEIIALLTQLQDELATSTIPVVNDTVEAFKGINHQSKFAQSLVQLLSTKGQRTVGPRESIVEVIAGSLVNLNDNIDFLEKEVKRLFAISFSREGLTYKRIALLKYIESAMFYVQYARKAVLRIIAEEALAVGGGTPLTWAKAEMEWLNENAGAFAGLYSAIAVTTDELKQAFSQTSDAVFEEEQVDLAVQSLGNRAVNPMRIYNLAPNDNFLFSIGKAIAELKVKRFQASKAEHQSLQLRLQEYRELANSGNADPKLQKLIKLTESRIESLDYQINKITQQSAM